MLECRYLGTDLSLAFIAFPFALSDLPLAHVWTVVFLAMLYMLATDTEVSGWLPRKGHLFLNIMTVGLADTTVFFFILT